MQCKDIPAIPILAYIFLINVKYGPCFTCWEGERDVRNGFPEKYNTPQNLVLAKLYKLHRQKLIDGCTCGCRGDFTITPKGIEFLVAAQDNNTPLQDDEFQYWR
jgi:hypothetical protein